MIPPVINFHVFRYYSGELNSIRLNDYIQIKIRPSKNQIPDYPANKIYLNVIFLGTQRNSFYQFLQVLRKFIKFVLMAVQYLFKLWLTYQVAKLRRRLFLFLEIDKV